MDRWVFCIRVHVSILCMRGYVSRATAIVHATVVHATVVHATMPAPVVAQDRRLHNRHLIYVSHSGM